jgi:hypothetical protein
VVYANVILDDLPERFYGVLVEFLGDDDDAAVDKLADIEPKVQSYRPWFIQLCGLIREGIVEDDGDGDLTPAGGSGISAPSQDGKAPHASNNAEARDSN